jgi:hypothetical protein
MLITSFPIIIGFIYISRGFTEDLLFEGSIFDDCSSLFPLRNFGFAFLKALFDDEDILDNVDVKSTEAVDAVTVGDSSLTVTSVTIASTSMTTFGLSIHHFKVKS